jgi:hypothetical protein
MKTSLVLPIAFVGFALAGCEQKSAEPKQSTPTPTPAPSASPETTPSAPPSASPAESPSNSPAANSNESSSDRPQFASQSANDFVESYDAFIADFKAAYEAMRNRDMTKYDAVILRAQELETKGEKLERELSPDEQKKFADYLNRRADELAELTIAK